MAEEQLPDLPATTTIPPDANHVQNVRRHLLDQMAALRGATEPEAVGREIERAKGLADLAKAVTDTARVEVEYLKVTGQGRGSSSFLETPPDRPYIGAGPAPAPAPTPTASRGIAPLPPEGPWPNGINSVTRHYLRDD